MPQRVTFESADKTPIVGTFYGSPNPNSPAVLMLHQWMSDRHSYDNLAMRMQPKGFGVLIIDGRGFGESVKAADGKTIGPSRSAEAVAGMKADVGAALDFLAGQINVDPARIGIVGASYGSSLALIYAAEDPRVKAAALLSPGLNYFGNMPTEPAVKKYGDRPLLLVAADDDAESAKSVRKLKEAGANDKYEVKIYPKGGHGTGLFGAKVGLEDLLEQFFARNLAK
jgi:dienelactone hydrolase